LGLNRQQTRDTTEPN